MAGLIRRGLRQGRPLGGFAGTGEDALWMAQAVEYDAIVLDVMLPGISGFETCRKLRNSGVWAPVSCSRRATPSRTASPDLDTGADDYLVKPFAFAELLARLRALARRGELERPAVLEVGDLRLDPATREVAPRRTRDPAVRQGVRAARDVHAPTGRGPVARASSRARLGLRLRQPFQRGRRLRPPPRV